MATTLPLGTFRLMPFNMARLPYEKSTLSISTKDCEGEEDKILIRYGGQECSREATIMFILSPTMLILVIAASVAG